MNSEMHQQCDAHDMMRVYGAVCGWNECPTMGSSRDFKSCLYAAAFRQTPQQDQRPVS